MGALQQLISSYGTPAYSVKVGQFTANTSTGNQEVDTGTGVTGKAVYFFGHKATTAGNVANAEFFHGAATSSSERWSTWMENEDAQATSDASYYYDDTKCISIYNTVATVPTINGNADFVSFGTGVNAGKFTINWVDAPAGAYIIYYMIWGGTDITNVKAGSFTLPAATGDQDISSVGFTPDFTLFSNPLSGSTDQPAPYGATHMEVNIGMATSSNQGAVSTKSEGNRATWDNYRYQNAAKVHVYSDNELDTNFASYSTGIANGFRLNWTAINGTGLSELFYLAFKGGNYQVGTFTTQTSTGQFSVNTNFRASGLLCLSAMTPDATHTANSKLTVGAASSSSDRGCVGLADDEAGEVADTRSSTSKIYENITAGTPTVNGEIDLVSFNATTMTLDQTDADPTGQVVIFAAFGAAGS